MCETVVEPPELIYIDYVVDTQQKLGDELPQSSSMSVDVDRNADDGGMPEKKKEMERPPISVTLQ